MKIQTNQLEIRCPDGIMVTYHRDFNIDSGRCCYGNQER